MKYIILVFLLFIILNIFIIYKFNEKFNTNTYKSSTQIEGDYEVYSGNDKFYPSYKINLQKRNNLIKLLKYGDDFFQKNNINYSIIYGSLLGYIRNKKIIPYDHDTDCIIGKESLDKLVKLGYDKSVKNVIFSDEILKYNPNFNSDTIYLILNKSLLTNNGYGEKFNCKGTKGSSGDACSFRGLFGRFVLKKYYYDLFPYSHNLKNLIKKKNNNHIAYPDKLDDMSIIDKKDIIRSKLEDIDVSVFNHTKANKILKFYYGENYMKPSK